MEQTELWNKHFKLRQNEELKRKEWTEALVKFGYTSTQARAAEDEFIEVARAANKAMEKAISSSLKSRNK